MVATLDACSVQPIRHLSNGSHGHLDILFPRRPGAVELALVSQGVAIVPTMWRGCELSERAIPTPPQHRCRFSYDIGLSNGGVYRLALRGDVCRIRSDEYRVDSDAFALLGFTLGREWQIRMRPPDVSLRLASHASHHASHQHSGQNVKPSCTFAHEEQLTELAGAPRWQAHPWANSHVERVRSELWYNDTFAWGNDLCALEPISMRQLSSALHAQGVERMLLLGDSTSRQMFHDYEELERGVTMRWIETHPLQRLRSNASSAAAASSTTSNWDGLVGEWADPPSKDYPHEWREHRIDAPASASNATGTGGTPPARPSLLATCGWCWRAWVRRGSAADDGADSDSRRCCLSDACEPSQRLAISYLSFAPGMPGQPKSARSVAAWREYFASVLAAGGDPQLVVFNVGLWLLTAHTKFHDPAGELSKMVSALAGLCDQRRCKLVWRATTFEHLNAAHSPRIRAFNAAATAAMRHHGGSAVDVASGAPLAFQTTYLMSAVRPDRTSDGLHYSYHDSVTKLAWTACDAPQNRNASFPNCIRDTSWPPSVSRGMSMVLAHLLSTANLTR